MSALVTSFLLSTLCICHQFSDIPVANKNITGKKKDKTKKPQQLEILQDDYGNGGKL